MSKARIGELLYALHEIEETCDDVLDDNDVIAQCMHHRTNQWRDDQIVPYRCIW